MAVTDGQGSLARRPPDTPAVDDPNADAPMAGYVLDAAPAGFTTLRELLDTILERWVLALLTFALVFGLAVVVTEVQTPVFQARSLLLVKLGREFVYRAEVGDRQAFVPRDREKILNSEIQILRGRSVLKATLNQAGVDRVYPDIGSADLSDHLKLTEAIRRLRVDLSVQAVPDTDVIRVMLNNTSPQVAAETLNLLLQRFREKHLEAFSGHDTTAFLEEKAAQYRERLQESEAGINAFEAENKAFSFRDSGDFLQRQREALGLALREVERDTGEVRRRATREDPGVAKAKAQLLGLQLEEQKLVARFNGSNREVAEIRKEIQLVRNFVSELESATREQTSGEIALLDGRRRKLQLEIASVEVGLNELPELSRRYRELVRERDANELHYTSHKRRLEEALVSLEMDRENLTNLTVIEHAAVPVRPIAPRKRLNMAVGLLVALILAGLVPYFVESLSRAAVNPPHGRA